MAKKMLVVIMAAACVVGLLVALPALAQKARPSKAPRLADKACASKPRVLLVVTSAATMGGAEAKPTGVWLDELSTPYYAFLDAGAVVTIASIKGGPAPIDPGSLKPKGQNEPSVERLLADENASAMLKNTRGIEDLRVEDYDAIFLPGGHGTMWDLPTSGSLSRMLGAAWAQGKVVAAVCHGPAGLVDAKDEAGQPLVKGRKVTGFSDAEERAVGLDTVVPFLLESRLRALGGQYESAENFKEHAVADGRLVTGQNPASAGKTAELTLQALRAECKDTKAKASPRKPSAPPPPKRP